MNGCNNCKFQPRCSPDVFNNVCQKGHPSAIDFPPCRDFQIVPMMKTDKIGEAIREFTKKVMEFTPNLRTPQTIEYVYIGLFRNGDLGLTELPLMNNYRRIEMGRYDWMRNGCEMSNVTEIEYPPAAKAWGMVTHFGLFDSINGGQLIVTGPIEKPMMIEEGYIVRFETANMKVTLNS